MHTAAQIQAQVHGHSVQAGQPGGRARQQVERDHMARTGRIGVERTLQRVARLDLIVGGLEAGLDRVAFELDQRRREPLGGQRLLDLGDRGRVHTHRGPPRRHLNGRRFTEDVGQGIQQTDHQRESDDQVLPERISVHEKATKVA
ncbi:hypothetical protein FQZ97_1114290 [compost metagenome]